MTSKAEVQRETAVLLRSLLQLVEAGEIEATSPQAKALVRRIEGAAVTLQVLSD